MLKDILCKTINMPVLVLLKLWFKQIVEYYAAIKE